MILTKEQQIEFTRIARPMIKFLCDNCHPHVEVNITTTNAQMVEGVCSTGDILDYLRD